MIFILEDGIVRLDYDDYVRLNGRSVWINSRGYASFRPDPATKQQTLHSFVMGGTREGLNIDHINGDRLDNRRSNLRFVTPQENSMNRVGLNKNNTSGVRGVRHNSRVKLRPWNAFITMNGKPTNLGWFATMEEAIDARLRAERNHLDNIKRSVK